MKPSACTCSFAIGITALTIGGALPIGAQESTPAGRIHVKEGFHVERLYSVPKDQQGSWVSMCVDDKGRLIVSDQYGGLYRMTPPPPGGTLAASAVESLEVDMGHAQGLLYAFDSLYAVVNAEEHGGRGLYRLRDTNDDDRFDSVEQLKKFEEQGGEHGPHAVVAGPDGKSLYLVCGNQTALPAHNHSRVPERWGEDLLLPRIYGRGFMRGVEAPRGWIAKTDPDGKDWEIVATGFRNEYDAAFNREGELFAYDADMEWDMNTPWYRPTRVCHVVSGAEFGWRNGSGKWPVYYSDSCPPVVDIGPGSPTGVAFGYGAKFPEKYQNALYLCDWSYGKLYAVHLSPDGATYSGAVEEFVSAQPLPLTDIAVNPKDGALYFTVGGRRVQSGLYRVTYDGAPDRYPSENRQPSGAARAQRLALESYHGRKARADLDVIWTHLDNDDRSLRYAARVALEHQPAASWVERVWSEANPGKLLPAAIALARVGEASHQAKLVERLAALDYAALRRQSRLDLLRAYTLTFLRLAPPDDSQKQAVLAQLGSHFPASAVDENVELSQLFVFFQDPSAAGVLVERIERAPSQEEQLSYGKNLRLLTAGWTPELEERYFKWIGRAMTYKGGASFANFVASIRKDAESRLAPARLAELQPIVDAAAQSDGPKFTFEPRSFVQHWSVGDFDDVINVGLEGGRNFENGRNLFGAATCFACHRFNQEGGAFGPDLTSVAGKFSPRDLLESIIEPSKEISDQYNSIVITKHDDSVVIGRIVNLSGDTVMVNTDMLDPDAMTNVSSNDIQSIEPSKLSMLPPGLLDILKKDDVLDLLAYLLSMGDRQSPLFR